MRVSTWLESVSHLKEETMDLPALCDKNFNTPSYIHNMCIDYTP